MSRKILFRGKRLENDAWVFGSFCMDAVEQKNDLCGVDGFIRLYDFDSHKTQMYEVDRKTVGQFTGLYDEELEPIYEGDVVEYTHKDRKILGHIVFEEGAFGIGKRGDPLSLDLLDSTHNDHFISLWELIYNSDCYEDAVDGLKVRGNIHDDPGLEGLSCG